MTFWNYIGEFFLFRWLFGSPMKLCGLLPTRWRSCFSAIAQRYNDISKESMMKVS